MTLGHNARRTGCLRHPRHPQSASASVLGSRGVRLGFVGAWVLVRKVRFYGGFYFIT